MKYYYQFKIALFGFQNVGKKTLLKQLDSQTDFKQIKLQDKIQKTLYIYDIFHDLTQQEEFLCYIFVNDQTQNSIKYSIDILQGIKLNKQYQFILFISNKIDSSLGIQNELEEFCNTNSICFIETSALKGTNINVLSNLLRIKAQIIMKKCQIEPFLIKSENIEQKCCDSPFRPLPKTPESKRQQESDYKSINSESVESFRLLQFEREFGKNLLNTQQVKKANIDMTHRYSNKLRSSSQITKKLLILNISLNKYINREQHQIYNIDVYQEDSLSLIVERLCSMMNKKIKQQAKKNLFQIIEMAIDNFLMKLSAQFKDKKYLKVKDTYVKFINEQNLGVQLQKQMIINQWNNPIDSIGIIVIIIKSKVIKIYIHQNDEPYDLAFSCIMDFNLKKNCISSLVDKIILLQNQSNIKFLGLFDFTQHELIVLKCEDYHKKLFSFFMQHNLSYEDYKILQEIQ